MKKKLFAFVIIMALALSLAGCADLRPGRAEALAVEPQAAPEEDGQNPVMNFVGVYHMEDSMEALVEAEGADNAKITVTYAGSPWFHHRTVMSGAFDAETLTVSFTNAVMTEYTYKSDGSVDEEKITYEDGTGRAVFSQEDNTLTITEEFPSGDFETVYTWGEAPNMMTVSDPDHYASVTAMDKAQVETVVGFNVRTAYLSQNWYALADMIRYPITINGTQLADADAFLGYMIDKTVAESDREAMLAEDFLDMFVNDQGIMMGDGQIWLSDPNYMTDQEPELQIIAMNGIVSAEESDTADAGRKDGERFETTILLEGMEETVAYEHAVNPFIGIEIDYEYESLERQSEKDRECFVSIYDDPDAPENYLEVTCSPEDADTVIASVSEALSQEYELFTEPYTLDGAGSCTRIDASEAAGHQGTPNELQAVYIIPAGEVCYIAAAHYTIESAEGFGSRFAYMLDTLRFIG